MKKVGDAINRSLAVQALKELQQIYLSPQYAANQPMSSIAERFAVGQCIETLEALPPVPR